MELDYPKRGKCFSNRFLQLIFDIDLGVEIGTLGVALLTVVVSKEDRIRYARAPNFWYSQLLRAVGLKETSKQSLSQAIRCCRESGWLIYQPGTKAKAGRMWVDVPPEYHEEFRIKSHEVNTQKSAKIQLHKTTESGPNRIPNAQPNRNRNACASIPSSKTATKLGRNSKAKSDQLNMKWERALELAIEIWPILRPKKGNGDLARKDRAFVARVCYLASTELSEDWLRDSLGSVTQCATHNAMGKFSTACREKSQKKHGCDFDELAGKVKVPKSFYNRLEQRESIVTGNQPFPQSINTLGSEPSEREHEHARQSVLAKLRRLQD